ncbi:helix-turn-helix domain-containing protein [uncultured Prevotella sp.]|uniref:helix-turn-helix domain-containing protein n=1 Tax=uncultured Prevotella sp. TaxID=159272 RepID=UPI002591907B|nr:helix-turn-helix domain-containing protein [uncultured Prevotella sp.]
MKYFRKTSSGDNKCVAMALSAHHLLTVCLTIVLLAFALSLTAHPLRATTADMATYRRLSEKSTAMLMKKAGTFLHSPNGQDSALLYYTIVANRYNEDGIGDAERKECITAMNNAGYLYYAFYNDYNKAYTTLRQALQLAAKSGDKYNEAMINLNMANIKSVFLDVQGDQPQLARETLQLYRKAFYQSVEIRNWPLAVGIFTNMLDENFVGEPSLYSQLRKDISAFKRMRIPAGTPLLDFTRATISCVEAIHSHNYVKALAATYAMERNIESRDTPKRFAAEALGLRTKIFNLMHDDRRAVETMLKGVDLCKANHIDDGLMHFYVMLNRFFLSRGDSAKAQQYRLDYLELKEKILTENNLQSVSRLEFLYELREANTTVERLTEQKHWLNIITTVIIVFAIIVSLLLVFIFRSYRRAMRTTRILYRNVQDSLHREEEDKTKYKGSRLTDDAKELLAQRIDAVMQNTDEICNSDFNLDRLAELANSNYKEVSQVINEHYGKNFKALLNECRIREACRRLTDANYGHLTIEGVAISVGIKSRSHFNSYFKQVTGMSPSVYQKISKEEEKAD